MEAPEGFALSLNRGSAYEVSERHAFFLGESFQSNVEAIERRVPGDWRVICGHCGVGLAGSSGRGGERQDIIWRHDRANWFGSFQFPTSEHTP